MRYEVLDTLLGVDNGQNFFKAEITEPCEVTIVLRLFYLLIIMKFANIMSLNKHSIIIYSTQQRGRHGNNVFL